ncbi:MAG TPA: L-2-hydroxyglutarate oxidase [Streptosporangiaceae bacterium]|nr:L-2-hydroxyglutarate oxidase [Streptosporangiaceae bacterium]
MTSERYDVAVVGAGIVGLAVAREVLIRRPGAKVVVVDKHSAVAQQQTGHNSGVIHAGVYYAPGSLKARLCVEGARLMYEFCAANGIGFERCGKLIVAIRADELRRLDDLETRGRANGVPGLRRVAAAEIAEIEPECRGLAALHSPATGIVDFGAVARAIEAELRAQGVTFELGCEITSIRRWSGPAATPASQGGTGQPAAGRSAAARASTVLSHAHGEFRADWAIVCAGMWSDRLAVCAGAPADPRIVPFRGAYLRLAAGQPEVVRGLVYPVPDPALPFLGVHVTRQVGGGVLLGPTALLVAARDGYRARPGHLPGRTGQAPAALRRLRGAPDSLRDGLATLTWPGTWRVVRAFWGTGLSELVMATSRKRFVAKCARYVPALAGVAIEPLTLFGIRAQAVGRDGRLVDDFVISQTPGATHVRNAPSPAATSSLALAREIVDRYEAATRR